MGRFDHLAPVVPRIAEAAMPLDSLDNNQTQLPVSPAFDADYPICPRKQAIPIQPSGKVPEGAAFEDTNFFYFPVNDENDSPKPVISAAEILFNPTHQKLITKRPVDTLPQSAKKLRNNHDYYRKTSEFAKDHRRLLAAGMIAVLAGGTLFQINGGFNGESALANIAGSGKTLSDLRGDNIMRSSSVGNVILNSGANLAIPIALINGQSAKIALPSTKKMPKAVINTDVAVYMSGTTDKSGNSTIFATAKGKKYLVDRHMIDLSSSFAQQGCPTTLAPKKICIDAFTGNVQIKPSASVSAAEATRINNLLQPKGKTFANYQAIALHKLESVDLVGIEKNCGLDLQRIGDIALRNLLIQQAARGGIKLGDKDVSFTNTYNPMSHSFTADNAADINSGILATENVSNTCTVKQAIAKG